MLVVALIFVALTGARGSQFNVTRLIVPPVVPPQRDEVDVECQYDANFTILSWFKGPNEFFRYKPGAAPSIRSFPILGVGRIKLLACGPTVCRLQLGALTKEATGIYRCDIERDIPPYKFGTQTAYMEVQGHENPQPIIEGLAHEYGNGDQMQAFCRGTQHGSELRWYINEREMKELRGSTTFKAPSSKWIFLGVPPKVTVQCAEFHHGKLLGAREVKALWREHDFHDSNDDKSAQEQRNVMKNGSNRTNKVSILWVLTYCIFQQI